MFAFCSWLLVTFFDWYRCRPQVKWRKVGNVEKVFVYPLKSGQPVLVQEAKIERLGLTTKSLRDRCFIPIKSETREYFNVRTNPKIVLIKVVYHDRKDAFIFSAPGMPDLEIRTTELSLDDELEVQLHDSTVKGLDCGNEASVWFSRFIVGKESGARVLYHHTRYEPLRGVRPSWSRLYPKTMTPDIIGTYGDVGPFMLHTRASMDDLNERLEEKVDDIRFRPNIVIKTTSGKPYEEDEWRGMVRIGDEGIIKFSKYCHRCISIQVDPYTGEFRAITQDPMKTLKEYRLPVEGDEDYRPEVKQYPVLGNHFGFVQSGTIKVGDEVFVEEC